MRCILVVDSRTGNTLKLANAIKKANDDIQIKKVEEVNSFMLSTYDCVGFGSGIYHNQFSKKLIRFIKTKLDDRADFVFIFSTSGSNDTYKNDKKIKKALLKKHKIILGEYGCIAYDKHTIFNWIRGGINKGHPDNFELYCGKRFYYEMENKYAEALKKITIIKPSEPSKNNKDIKKDETKKMLKEEKIK